MKKIITSLCLIFIATFSANSQNVNADIDREYHAELTRYMTLTGANYAYKAIIDQMVDMFALTASIDAEKKEQVKNSIRKKAINELIVDMTPAYQKNITLEDLKKMNEFYESDVAKRVVKSTPFLIKDITSISQQWAVGLQVMILEAIKKE